MIKLLIIIKLLLFCHVLVFAGGKAEEESVFQNNEWVICITEFDVSALPPSRQIMGDLLARELRNVLGGITHRYRDDEEIDFYENLAWNRERSAAARTLAARKQDRDMLLFQGNPSWRHRRDIRTRDEEIQRLIDSLAAIENERPSVNREPLVSITTGNIGGVWPPPPASGGERRFCREQNADAFIAGTMTEYHGRILVHLKMYTLYTRSFSFENMIIFSPEDAGEALSELSSAVFARVLSAEPAVLAISATPDDAIILIDGAFAGRGETPEMEFTPGQMEIVIDRENFATSRFFVDINPGEITDIKVNLFPLNMERFSFDVPEHPGSSVYLGGLFRGEAPLNLDLVRGEPAYISVETPGGDIASAVFRNGRVVQSNADFDRTGNSVFIYGPPMPDDPNEKRIGNAKNKFYNSWGRFWIILPVSLITAGVAGNYIDAYYNNSTSQDVYNSAVNANYVYSAAYGLLSLAAADLVYKIYRYIRISGSDAVPLAVFPSTGEE